MGFLNGVPKVKPWEFDKIQVVFLDVPVGR